MAKPSAPVTWCTTGTRVTASPDKQAVGFVTRERPSSQCFNDLFGRLGDWTQYLSDGAFEGASSFDDDLDVAGNLTIGGTLGVSGDLSTGDLDVAGELGTAGSALSFSPTTVFANATTDTINTSGALDTLRTGAGPVRCGTTGTMPAGLTAGADYWIILATTGSDVVGTNYSLAASLDDALAGTAVNFTTSGSGTLTMSSVAGTKRVRWIAPTDGSVTASKLRVGDTVTARDVRIREAQYFPVPLSVCVDGTGGSVSAGVATLGGSGVFTVPVMVPAGWRLLALVVGVSGNSSADLSVSTLRTTELGVQTSITCSGAVNPPAGFLEFGFSASVGGPIATLQTDSVYEISLAPSAVGLQLTAPRLLCDRP